jgi:hypothetical protein
MIRWRSAAGSAAVAFLLGTPLQFAKGLFIAASELLIDDVAAGAVVVALESGKQSGAQFFDESPHRFAQADSAPRRQLQPAGFLRVGKIVDVAPVGWRRHGRRTLAQ